MEFIFPVFLVQKLKTHCNSLAVYSALANFVSEIPGCLGHECIMSFSQHASSPFSL